MSSLSSSFSGKVNTKKEAYLLIHDPAHLFSLLYSKYGDIEEDYYLLNINQLLYNYPSKLNSIFKELKYIDITHDYLKRIYSKSESISRIPKLSDYYKNYHMFFCRPTLRNSKLGKIMCDYEDNKAEIFYKNNYEESKDELSGKENSIGKNKDKDKEKKNTSLSFSSFDNTTNNEIIFDKETKKILDKNETDNNNYYNTLTLETSNSNLFLNNNLLYSKRSGDDSFENCIHALVMYQYKKNKSKNEEKKQKNKSAQKSLSKNSKGKKYININYYNSNYYKNFKPDNKKNMSQSQREGHYKSNLNLNINNQKNLSTFYMAKKNNIKKNKSKITRVNSNSNQNNKLMISKKKKNSLFSLSNNKYLSPKNIMNNINKLLDKKNKKYNNNNNIVPKIEEFNLNNLNRQQFTNNNNKSGFNYNIPGTTKKNKTYILSNSGMNHSNNNSNNQSNIYSNLKLNINPNINIDIIKNLKFDTESNSKNFSKLTEYLKQTKNKDIQCIRDNFVQKKIIHKKNNISIGGGENRNMCFNLNNNNTNNNYTHHRVTKKKVTINKNLKITVTNINNYGSVNNIKMNSQKAKHTKNKTFDYNTINHQASSFLKHNPNLTSFDEFNSIFTKPKKVISKLNTESNNNPKNNKINFNNAKGDNSSKNKIAKKKQHIFSPLSNKTFNKISFTQTTSGEKSRKKNLIVKIFNPNHKKIDAEYIQNYSPIPIKNSYSVMNTEELNSNFIIKKNLNKANKNNCYINSNNSILKNIKNISSNISPVNHNNIIHHSKFYKKLNYTQTQNLSLSNKNSIYKKKIKNKNSKIINHKKANNNNIIINNNNSRKIKEYYSNIYLTSNNISNNNTSKNISENKALSRNKKKINGQMTTKNTKAINFNHSRKNKGITKSNSNLKNYYSNNNNTNLSILNSNISLNSNILNTNDNINISIGENNINIKDSILHINEIYIKSNNNIINNKSPKISKVNSGNNCCLKCRKGTDLKVDECRMKNGGNVYKRNKDNLKYINFPKVRYNYSPKMNTEVNKNPNFIIKNNAKKPNL